MRKIAGLFPGQGSQQVGMGSEFFQSSEIARELFKKADEALGGYSLSNLCFSGPLETLTLTENAQPAILVSSIVAFKIAGINLCSAAGHSLGEYSALVAAGAIDFADAIALVHKRGRYMQEAVKPGAGKMIAVLGPSEEEINEVIRKLDGVCEIANINSPGQIVVAGSALSIDAFSSTITSTGAKVIPLNVSAPFHCSLMAPAAERLAKDLDAISFSSPSFPVYSNVTAQIIESGESARKLLKAQVCSSVQWIRSMENMIREQNITDTVEFGTGGVLSKLLKRIDPKPKRLEIYNPDSLQKTLINIAAAA